MATLETDEANLVDAEQFNWGLIVYPVLVILVIVVVGFGYFYHQQEQRQELETNARGALLLAKTPEEWVKVADQYPASTQATLALMKAGNASYAKHDYGAATADYQRILDSTTTDPDLRDSAELGLAACLEASGKVDEAIKANLVVGDEGAKSPYAPFAYFTAARLYEERGDKDNMRKTLTEAASLDPDSIFVKQAQMKLKQITAAEQPPVKPAATLSPSTSITPPAPATSGPAAATPNVPATLAPAASPTPVPPQTAVTAPAPTPSAK